jgi:hypothetical protein
MVGQRTARAISVVLGLVSWPVSPSDCSRTDSYSFSDCHPRELPRGFQKLFQSSSPGAETPGMSESDRRRNLSKLDVTCLKRCSNFVGYVVTSSSLEKATYTADRTNHPNSNSCSAATFCRPCHASSSRKIARWVLKAFSRSSRRRSKYIALTKVFLLIDLALSSPGLIKEIPARWLSPEIRGRTVAIDGPLLTSRFFFATGGQELESKRMIVGWHA